MSDARKSILAQIDAEREHQIRDNGWTPAHDDTHRHGELALGAAFYAAPVEIRAMMAVPCGCRTAMCPHSTFPLTDWRPAWPFDNPPKRKGRRQDLIRAAGMIVAEIERLDRAEPMTPPQGGKP